MPPPVRIVCPTAASEADAARRPTCESSEDDARSVVEAEKVVTNSIGMKLVLVPAGEFMMGFRERSDRLAKAFGGGISATLAFGEGRPLHRVRITKPFYLGAYTVTRGQFRRFINETGYKPEAELIMPRGEAGGGGRVLRPDGTVGRGPQFTWETPGFPQTDEHPVTNVNWNDAVAFCQWLSREEGHTYRLPTEAEWEYACRAGTQTRYSCGDDPEKLAQVGNVADGTLKAWWPRWGQGQGGGPWPPGDAAIVAKDGYVFTAPVGQFKPNPWGFYDMHGNVGERCADWFDSEYYKTSPGEDPAGPSSRGPYDLHHRVIRGGSFNDSPARAMSSFRTHLAYSAEVVDVGFRVVRTVGEKTQKDRTINGSP